MHLNLFLLKETWKWKIEETKKKKKNNQKFRRRNESKRKTSVSQKQSWKIIRYERAFRFSAVLPLWKRVSERVQLLVLSNAQWTCLERSRSRLKDICSFYLCFILIYVLRGCRKRSILYIRYKGKGNNSFRTGSLC